MICNKCGTQNSDNSKYCLGCGSELTPNVQPMNNYNQPMYNQPVQQPIQQPVQQIVQQPMNTPMYNQQPVNGYAQPVYPMYGQQKKSNIGLIVGIIIGVLALGFIGLVVLGTIVTKAYPVAGKWDCKSFDGSGAKGDYLVTFDMGYDKKFTWEKYGDGTNNHVKGTYTFEKVDKSNNNTKYKYYNVKLVGNEYINNGVKQTQAYNAQYEMGIIDNKDGKRQAILINPYTYRMYYCYER